MVDSYLSTKFDINLLYGLLYGFMVSEKTRRMSTDACATAIVLLTQSSRAKIYFIHLCTYTEINSIILRSAVIKMQDCWNQKNRKSTEWPQTDFKHLKVRNTVCAPSTCPWGPNFAPFHSTTSRFEILLILLKIRKFGNTPNDLRLILDTKQSKKPCMH